MTLRAPTPDHLPETLALLRAFDAEASGDSDWTEEDLREHWGGLDLERDAWIVELDRRISGWYHRPRTFEEAAPELFGRERHDPSLCFVALSVLHEVIVYEKELRAD